MRRERRESEGVTGSHTTIQSGMCSAARLMRCKGEREDVGFAGMAAGMDGRRTDGWHGMALHIADIAVAAFKITAASRDI